MNAAETADRGDAAAGFAARSDVGLARAGNEDGFLARPPLFVVADGMGGHRAGEVASALVVRLVGEALSGPSAAVPAAITAAVEAANEAVWNEARDRPELSGMGTTCTIAVLDGARAHVAHVGDSRAYLLRGATLQQLTSDHTLVASMVREGILSDDDARDDDRRHIITRAIGAEREVRVDLSTHDLRPGDRLLLCSDGLSSQVDDSVIADVLADELDPTRAVDRLIDLANQAGGVDNVTVIVVDPDRLATLASDSPTLIAGGDRGQAHRTVIEPATDLDATAPVSVPAVRPVEPGPDVRAVPAGSRRAQRANRWRRLAVLLTAVLIGLLGLVALRGVGSGPADPTPGPSLSPTPSSVAPSFSEGPVRESPVPGVGGEDTPPPGVGPGSRTPGPASP